MAHDVLAKTIDAMLHVQFPDPWRDLLHLLVVALLTTHSRRRDVGIHGRRNMHADRVYAVQSVGDFWSWEIASAKRKILRMDIGAHSKKYLPVSDRVVRLGWKGLASSGVISTYRST